MHVFFRRNLEVHMDDYYEDVLPFGGSLEDYYNASQERRRQIALDLESALAAQKRSKEPPREPPPARAA